jgi:succinyl-CoA synthetase beta subunit
MNIHEYQAKALLKDYGAPVAAASPSSRRPTSGGGGEALPARSMW